MDPPPIGPSRAWLRPGEPARHTRTSALPHSERRCAPTGSVQHLREKSGGKPLAGGEAVEEAAPFVNPICVQGIGEIGITCAGAAIAIAIANYHATGKHP